MADLNISPEQAGHQDAKLGRQERLKSRKTIERLFKEGKVVISSPLRLTYLVSPGPFSVQAGFTVSSRNFRKAVDRNRIKRLLRECYRTQKGIIYKQLNAAQAGTDPAGSHKHLSIFLMYTGKTLPLNKDIEEKMKTVLSKLCAQLP